MSDERKDNAEWLKNIGNDDDFWVTQDLCKSTWPVPIIQVIMKRLRNVLLKQ